MFSKESANIVYDILVEYGQANENDRASFVMAHCSEAGCQEWRFGGIAAGAKYRSKTNSVDVYYEAETAEVFRKVDRLNTELYKLPYIKILYHLGYKRLNHGYFLDGKFSRHWVTLFDGRKLQMYQYHDDNDEVSDEKIYDTSVIVASPFEMYQLIQILVINQKDK